MPMASSRAAEIFISNKALTQSVEQALFTDDGRWFLENSGPCNRAYLQSPMITTADGRLQLRARLRARKAIVYQGRCIGPAFDSIVLLSGALVISQDTMSLEQLRVDSIEDDATRLAYTVAMQADLVRLPQAVRFAFRPALDAALAQLPGWRIRADSLNLSLLGTDRQGVRLGIDFSLVVDELPAQR
ncbi:MAG: hypothetical protein R3E83_13065 [Burkholderiaceae bacterium]